LDEKKESKSGRVRLSLKRQSPALTTITFDGAMNFCLLHWLVKRHSPKLLPKSYSTIIFQTTQRNKTKLMLIIFQRITTAMLTLSLSLTLSERISQVTQMEEATIKHLAQKWCEQELTFGKTAMRQVPKQMTLRLPNFETISAVAVCCLLQICNLVKVVPKRPGLCQQPDKMKSLAPSMPSVGHFCLGN
jgi:hypothetical protein